MSMSTAFIRTLFVILSVIFMITYVAGAEMQPGMLTYLWGTLLGLVTGGILIGLDLLFKKFHLRFFNAAILGLFFGYLMALALILILNAIVQIAHLQSDHYFIEFVKIFIFLFATYLGVMMTLRATDEMYISIPFVKFAPTAQKTNDILLDSSALGDPRLVDLAATGLFDHRLVCPRFLLKELYKQEEDADEQTKIRAQRGLDVIAKLVALPSLHLRYQETDFPEVKDLFVKTVRLARLLDADILSADVNKTQVPQLEGVRLINIHTLSHILKPLMQRGEFLKIKIQREGKEKQQGIGYLKDGTMVVVNGGGDFIGKTIRTSVLSVKHTTSGRIIFCNIIEGDLETDLEEDEKYEEG